MRTLFVVSAIIMLALSVFAVQTLPEQRSDVPIMYWTTDDNPARRPQIAAFRKWLVENGHPDVELSVDAKAGGTAGATKIVIQCVSGVGSDIIDVGGGGELRQFVSAGILMDITDVAQEMGFDRSKTYEGIWENISVDERQYAFPANVFSMPLTINRGMLERAGLPLPKFDWTWDEFLQWCLEVVERDPVSGRTTRWPVVQTAPEAFWITNGGSLFNETMTRSIVNNPRVREATQFYADLMFKHHVTPTPLDVSAMAAQGGYLRGAVQLVARGEAAAVPMGRFILIQMRRFEDFVPDVALIPHKVMPMQIMTTRASAINAGGEHIEESLRFLQFLASPEYNEMIMNDSDALPPNPQTANHPDFRAPPGRPEEQYAHVGYYRSAAEHGVSAEFSPYLNPTTVERLRVKYVQGIEAGVETVEDALRKMQDEINFELTRTVERDSRLREHWEQAWARQQQIDRLKAAGEPVPLEWVSNPVLRAYYDAGHQALLTDPAEGGGNQTAAAAPAQETTHE